VTRRRLLRRLTLFAVPLVAAAAYIGAVWGLFIGAIATIILGAMLAYLVSPAGTEIVVPISVLYIRTVFSGLGSPDWGPAVAVAVASVILVDVFIALFLLWNFDLAERTPILGGFIRKAEERCRKMIERKKWGEGATLAALTAYVALPVQMSGGLVGSVLGRLLGISPRRVFAAVSIGSMLGAIPLGLISAFLPLSDLQGFSDWVQTWTWTQVAGVAVIAAFVIFIVYLVWRGKRNGGE